jgi:hypothetical protein
VEGVLARQGHKTRLLVDLIHTDCAVHFESLFRVGIVKGYCRLRGSCVQFYFPPVGTMAKGWKAFQSYKKRRSSNQTRRRVNMRANAAEFVPSWLQRSIRSSTRVVSNGINSLLREINTKRRRSLGETRKSR